MNNREKVVVAGHICFDIIPQILSEVEGFREMLCPGKLINVGKATVSSGGPVSNTGLALHRLGVKVKLMGKCGKDQFGWALIQSIKETAEGAEAGMQMVEGETTSYTVVIAPPGIDRLFLHCSGANDHFGKEDVDLEVVKEAGLFHFGYPPLMGGMYENGGEALAAIFQEVKGAGVTTSLDMALPDPQGANGKADWETILKKTLPSVDLFLPSVEELTFMLERQRYEALQKKAPKKDILGQINGELLSYLGRRCLEMGSAMVVIKCGHLGAYIQTAGQERLGQIGLAKPGDLRNWADREIFEPAYHVERVVSAAGSGDNSIAGFLAAYLRKLDIEQALRYLCAVGAHNVQVPDAVSGVKSWEQTSAAIEGGWSKNEVEIALPGWEYDREAKHYLGPNDNIKE